MRAFSERIITWQRRYGRHDLPWQGADPYRVWLSEVMLQQTQVATVVPYYLRFIEQFPNISSLAAAQEDAVLARWSGLGYYTRARNLHRAARMMHAQYGGEFPMDFESILALPGVGRSTAAAVCALAMHQRRAILDGNVKRVLARHRGIEGYPGKKAVELQMWNYAEAMLPDQDVAIYTQGLMDLGASVCTRTKPHCTKCPVRQDCEAFLSHRVAQLPTPRPRKEIPQRSATFLIVQDNVEILLEKRPASGIWGGLWCFPVLEEGADALASCKQRFGVEAEAMYTLSSFTHVFTHFRLHITPMLFKAERVASQSGESGWAWMNTNTALQAGLPAPVRKLVERLERASHERYIEI